MASPWRIPTEDLLGSVAEALSQGQFALADQLLRSLSRKNLTPADQGRAAAMEIIATATLQDERDEPNPERIELLFLSMLESRRDDKHFTLALGIELSERFHYAFAIRALKQLCETHGDIALPWYNLGLVHQRDGDLESAAEALRHAIRLDKTFPQSFINLAQCLDQLGHRGEAASCYEQYLVLEPKDEFHWVSLGILRSELGECAAADVAYRKALALDPTSTTAWYNRAVTASRYEQLDLLAESVAKLQRLSPHDFRCAAAEAMLRETQGQVWQAWESYLQAMDLASDMDESASAESDESNPHHRAEPTALHIALEFAIRHGLDAQVHALFDRMFSNRLFTPELLYAFRQRSSGTASVCAYQVLVQGRLTDPEVLSDPGESPSKPMDAIRSYQIAASNESQAAELALAFDRRIAQIRDPQINEVSVINATPTEAHLGVVHVSGLMCYPASDTTDDD